MFKKIIFFSIVLITSCKQSNVKKIDQEVILSKTGETYQVYEWEHKDHIYLISKNSSGISLTHAGHCHCNKIN